MVTPLLKSFVNFFLISLEFLDIIVIPMYSSTPCIKKSTVFEAAKYVRME